jgi:hypothetical protein
VSARVGERRRGLTAGQVIGDRGALLRQKSFRLTMSVRTALGV